jgi:hypothetical protein
MQFKVVIPASCNEGEIIRINCPDGTQANVQIPDGLHGGDSFIFEVPNNQLKNPDVFFGNKNDETKQQQGSNSSSSGRRVDHDKLPLATTESTFVGREIVNRQGKIC